MRIVFIGPPGAGKGTQSQLLLGHLGIPHLSSGELLRRAIADKSEVGRLAERFISQGQLVPDDVILDMVYERLQQPDCAGGVLFDGFPRTLPQARALDEHLRLHAQPLDVVLELQVDDAEVIRRLSSRGRKDDRPEVIAQRLDSYWRQTRPLLDYYGRQGLVEPIAGLGAPEEVFTQIERVIERRRHK